MLCPMICAQGVGAGHTRWDGMLGLACWGGVLGVACWGGRESRQGSAAPAHPARLAHSPPPLLLDSCWSPMLLLRAASEPGG